MKYDPFVIGNNIKKAREATGKTVEQVAQEVSLADEQYRRVEAGTFPIEIGTFLRIGRAVNVHAPADVMWLLGAHEEELNSA